MNLVVMFILFSLVAILTFPLGINLIKDIMCSFSGKFVCSKQGHRIEQEGNFCSRCGEY